VARRIALALGVVLAVSLAGDLSVHAQPVATTTLQLATPEPFAHKPARPKRVLPGTFVARVKPGRVVAVRSAPGGRSSHASRRAPSSVRRAPSPPPAPGVASA
jgi:hypothetical protein